ncbi:MAG: HAMP domain-containing histidine kinase [Deltaproteobacteria bacterium]|nr:HAMP domain-containing histidine kinase [Deltaproteobacteria bacterium]
MARRRNLRSISTPIILGAVSIVLSLALLVGWTILLANNLAENDDATLDVWLLVVGTVSFIVVVTILLLMSLYLAREILEVRRQDTFIDSVTHELKSPLASLKLCLETMVRPDLPEEKREQLHGMMLGDVERLTSFIDDVLQSTRLASAGSVGINLSDVELRALVERVAISSAMRHARPEGMVTIEIPESMVVVTDEAALEIVLKNLVDNALKYSPKDAGIEIGAERDERGRAILEVRDHGMGIERRHLKRVFNRFFRVQKPEVRQRRGTGLGLFVVSALVRNLGGKVEAESEGEGQGTTMRITLPANDEISAKAGDRQ